MENGEKYITPKATPPRFEMIPLQELVVGLLIVLTIITPILIVVGIFVAPPYLSDYFYKKGTEAYQEKDLMEARENFKRSFSFKKREDALKNLSQVYMEQGEYDLIIKEFPKLAEKNPKYKEILTPKIAYAHLKNGLKHSKKKQYDLAQNDFKNAVKLDPALENLEKSDYYLYRGDAFFFCTAFKRDAKKALKDYDKALKMNPRLARAYFNRAQVYVFQGDYAKTLQDLEKAVETDPNLKSEVKKKIDYYYDWYKRGAKENFDGGLNYAWAIYYAERMEAFADGDKTKIKEARRLASRGMMNFGVEEMAKNREKSSLFSLNSALEKNPKNTLVYLHRARVKRYFLRWREALDDFEKFKKEAPVAGLFVSVDEDIAQLKNLLEREKIQEEDKKPLSLFYVYESGENSANYIKTSDGDLFLANSFFRGLPSGWYRGEFLPAEKYIEPNKLIRLYCTLDGTQRVCNFQCTGTTLFKILDKKSTSVSDTSGKGAQSIKIYKINLESPDKKTTKVRITGYPAAGKLTVGQYVYGIRQGPKITLYQNDRYGFVEMPCDVSK